MEGSVRKRGSKWYYSFEAGSIEGKRKRIERVGGRTKKEAEAALRKALLEYENSGLHFEPNEISVSDYMDYWFKNYVLLNCKYKTQKEYESFIREHIKPALGIYKLKSLTPTILQEFVNEKFKNGYSKSYLGCMFAVISGSLKYAVHPCEYIKDNPAQYVKIPKYEHSKLGTGHKIISKDDFKKIIQRFPFGTSYYMAIMLGYHTGCRIGEATGLTWNDVNLDKGIISVNKILHRRKKNWYFGSTKTKASVREIKIGKTLVDALKQHKKWQAENRLKYGQYFNQQYEKEEIINNEVLRRIYPLEVSLNSKIGNPINMVCTQENGTMVTPEVFKYASKVIHYELGLTFNFHSLRHTHATTLIENGANIKDVQKRLGHSRIGTTLDTYTHQTENMAEQSVSIFEKAIDTDLPTT